MPTKITYYFRCLGWVLPIILGACRTSPALSPEVERWQAQAEQVTIYRDDFGVPHVYGTTDADAVFGLMYAQCEDDFNRVERNYLWATGRLAEVEGEAALYSDLRAKLFMTQEEAVAHYEDSPEWLRKLCNAWADGINYYLHTHPAVQRHLTRFEPWMPMYFSEGSIGGDIERVSTRQLQAFYENTPTVPEREPEPAVEEPQGSNGIAIAGELTRSGNAMLLINPHTSFYFRGEVHVVSEEGLNAYGAVTWGQFFVYQGFNETTGWMHTSTYTDVIDEFRETIERRGDRLVYQYGDEWRPVETYEVTLDYRDGEDTKQRTFTAYRTHHGPITHQEDGQWVATALMWEPVKALEQSYTRTKQSSYDGFRRMMDIRTNSSNNTVYADADGNIAYFHGNFIPRRDTTFDYTESVDGSNPQTDWQGLHSVDESIVVHNPPNGWIQNCNSTPFTAAGEYSPKRSDYPRYMSIDRENFRGVHAIALLRDRSGYTLDSLIELAHDPYLPAFAALIPGLVTAYDASDKNEALSAPVETLRAWDFTTSEASVAMTLAHYYATLYQREDTSPPGLTPMERITYYGSESPPAERLRVFARAVQQLETDFGTWEMPWGEVNRYQRPSGAIDLDFDDDQPSTPIGFAPGRWGALASYTGRSDSDTKKIYGTSGNSFVAAVEFGDSVRAKTILVGGQNSDPASPHFDDQVEPYRQVEFKEVPYYRAAVEVRAQETYQPGRN
jgi:acyl-homoserine lactone acylase PvdQ